MTSTFCSYEEVAYDDLAYHHTHPRLLAMVAALNGLQPPAVEHCRVLELGCAAGANLLPMTQSLPGATFVGIDQSAKQIAQGQKILEETGIKNLELRAGDLVEVDESLGQFDYILCHGVYSWVPPEAQRKILAIFRQNLAPGGVAYLSYNTLPGWRVRGIVRDLLSYHARGCESAEEQMERAQVALERWYGALDEKGDLLTRLMRQEVGSLLGESPSYLYHEYFESWNTPMYFHQVLEQATEEGLQYLGEARVRTMASFQPPEMRSRLEGFSRWPLEQEQYHDFIRNRCFRQTLFCHADIKLEIVPSLACLSSLRVVGKAEPLSPIIDSYSPSPVRFQLPDRTQKLFTDPLIKTLVLCLKEAGPSGLGVEQIWHRVRSRLAHPQDRRFAQLLPDPRKLLQTLLECFREEYVDVEGFPPGAAVCQAESPRTSPLFRYQASRGMGITNLLHRPVDLSPLDAFLLQQLDGEHDRASLVVLLTALAKEQPDWFTEEESSEAVNPERLSDFLESRLASLAAESLLVE